MAGELGTLGIRCIPAIHRFVADRTTEDVEIEIAGKRRKLPVKFGWMHGSVYTLKAEFEPARAFAGERPVNLAPRLGIAYSPGKNGKTVFRGGLGRFYGHTPLLAGNFPMNPDRQVTLFDDLEILWDLRSLT